ncbi:MAG TPA: hypothetical protein DEO60_06030 [Bacteroidales bacterium]|jgi:hypothetical protein|nr:hypothetical protein [Bacteroidales bacterium]HBZ20665.1 hypothetical protein [Bacteroidales bacterium]
MSERRSILLRLDPKKLKALEKWAADEFRSTNGQIEFIIDDALRKAGRYKGSRDTGMESEDDLPPSGSKGGF